ncbi:MAG: phosphohistidine phosphatase SixA [Kiritimatiellia bacterium]|jgi:phosphohistidine phosphatase|nr:phosphohistidine phosphatase SixA [Kiritimatiellia bacterium]
MDNDDATNLYLVQHARALTKDEDSSRPLSKQGVADMHRVIKLLSKRKDVVRVREIRHSGKLRSQQTAELLCEAVETKHGLVEDAYLVPNADPSVWAGMLLGCAEDLMIVGHMPHLAKLAERLFVMGYATKKRPELTFKNGGVICLCRNEMGVWRKRWAVTP